VNQRQYRSCFYYQRQISKDKKHNDEVRFLKFGRKEGKSFKKY